MDRMTQPDQPATRTPQRIILMHGLWLRAFTLGRLAARLRVAGFATETLDFGSVRDEPAQTVAILRERLQGEARPCGIVGHSLGGVIALEALRRHPDLPVARVVCLGSPLRGSRAAQSLVRLGAGRWLLGRSETMLCEGLDAWEGSAEVGMIAGCLPVGLGFALAAMPKPHDGTVCAEETMLPGLADRIEVRTSHTGLLFSRTAADHAIHFLREGRFLHPAGQGAQTAMLESRHS